MLVFAGYIVVMEHRVPDNRGNDALVFENGCMKGRQSANKWRSNKQEPTQSISSTLPGACAEGQKVTPATLHHLFTRRKISRFDPPLGAEGTAVFPYYVDAVARDGGYLDKL